MPEPPPRMRFQIHLSTAVVLMFVAGALMWANLYTRREKWDLCRGFPYPFYRADIATDGTENYYDWEWMYLRIAMNIDFALLVLICVFYVLERLIRLAASKKGPP